jgi:pimeloyl-ACP methyl ester carboxylesterase
MDKRQKYVLWLCIAIALVLLGSFFANMVHRSWGKVAITDMTFVTVDGARMRALLYVPDSATIENPAPAVVACHGYNNTLEVQDVNCVELSRRGYVVMAIDDYDHGLSSFPDPRINKGVAPDMGSYAALQYLGTLPYVDAKRIGMVGHSLGGIIIEMAALRAYTNRAKNPSIVVPKAILPTEHTFLTDKDSKTFLLNPYPINVGDMFAKYDEWAENMWQVPKGSDINISKKAIAAMGFSGAEYGAYYMYGNKKKLTKNEAIAAAAAGKLRVLYQPSIIHPRAHFSRAAVADILDFFDITLKGGKESVPSTSQIWPWKQLFNGIALVGFFLFIIPFAFLMLEIRYFKKLVRREPVAPSIVTTTKNKVIYWIIFVLCLLPAPLVYNWAVGYPIGIKSMDRFVKTVFPTTSYFQLPAINGVVLLMLIVGAILLAIFIATYFFVMKGNRVTYNQLGVKLGIGDVGKALLLAAITFVAAYMLLVLIKFFFLSDVRFWVFSIKTLTPAKFFVLLKYLPFFLFFYLVNSLLLNSFTRMRGQKEWVNIILMVVANVAGLAMLTLLDYSWLFDKGIKMFPYVPYPPKTTSALAGVLLWNLLFILPLAAISARLFFKKTGTIWLGGFVNALIITLYAISNTVSSSGIL